MTEQLSATFADRHIGPRPDEVARMVPVSYTHLTLPTN